MKIFLLLFNVVWLLLAADRAHAEPVTALLFTAAFAATIPGQLVSLGLSVAFSFGVSLLQKALTKTPKQQAQGVKVEVQMGDDLSVSTVLGTYATAGKRKYVGTYGDIGGTPNAMLVDVIELGSMPVSGLSGLWVDDKKCTILWDQETSRGFPIEEFKNGDGDYFTWVRFHDGNQAEADSYLLSHFGEDNHRPWKATMVERGCPYAIMTYRFSQDFFSGIPASLFEVASPALYDLRKDSTNGGSGAHRWDDPTTWEPSDNSAVISYNLIRGLYYRDEWLFGGQNLAAHRLPPDSWIASANECDRLIEIKGEDTEKQFRAGYEITGDMEPLDVINDIRSGCAGRLAEVGGAFKLHVGGFGAAVYSFSDNDILVTEGQSFEPFPALDATYNAIEATFPEPKEKWASKNAPGLYDPDLEEADGLRRLPVDVQFPATPFSRQVQRLMRAMIKEERRFRTHQFYLPPDAWVLEPNDVVSWSSTRNGYEEKKFIIVSIEGEMTMNQLLTIKEVDPSDYDWSTDFELPTTDGWIGPIAAPEQEMTGWTVELATIADNANAPRRPAIRVSCAANLDDVKQVWVQVRNKETGDVVFDSNSSPYAAPFSWLLSGNWCLPATDYEARGKYAPYSSRKTAFSAWLDVTTPDTRLSFVDLAADIVESLQTLKDWIAEDLPASITDNAQTILQETQDRIAAIAQEQSERIDGAFEAASRYRALADELAAVRDYAANIDYGQYQQKEELRQELKVQIDTSIASFIDQVTAAANSNAAIVSRLTILEANTSNLQAEITAVDLAQSSNYQALSDRMALLSAGTDNQFDPVKLWVFDTGVEGWTGDGAPTVANGYLRPANHATDPYVVSPAALAVNANISRQVRARIRKTGNPTWEGYAWWMTSSDTTWDASRRLSLAAPNFDLNGFALLTWDLSWTGTIDEIRLDLSTAQTATDYFEIDWIAIGSPSPGASRADLATEQQARASGDAANAQQITLLQAQLDDVTGDVEAVSMAVSTLEGSVSQLGDDVTSQGQALTSLQQDVAGKASADALNQLSAEVDALGGGGIVSNGLAITVLRNSLLPLASEMLDQDFANFLGDMQGKKLTAEASQTLTTRIEETENSIDILSQSVTLLKVALPGKADGSALDALTVRVTATESDITSLSSSITSLQNSLTGKADATALQSLTNTVAQQGNTIGSQGTAITNLQNSLGGKASASALTTLSSTVDQQGDQITAQAQSLTSLTTSVNGITASARLKAEVLSGPSGYARIGFSAAAASGGATQSAGLYIDVPTNGSPPQVIVEANRFGVVSGGGAKANVFAVDSQGVYIDTAYIRSISTDKITFKDGSVQTTALARFAASQIFTAATAAAYTPGSSYENTLQLDDVPRDVGNGLLVFADLRAQITSGYEGQTLAVELWDLSNNVLAQTSITITTAGVAVTAYLHTLVQTTGNLHFKLIVKGVNGDATKFIVGRRTISAVLLNKSV